MNEKPEWFQLTQGDEIEPRHQVKRILRITALAAPLLILGTGFVMAQTQNGPDASANQTVSSTSVQPVAIQSAPENSSAPTTPATEEGAIVNANHSISLAPTPKSSDKAESAVATQVSVPSNIPSASTTPSQPVTITAPLIKPPTGGGDDRGGDDD